MSESGRSNDDTATVLRLFAARLDDRVTLSRKVTVYRKATRSRASSARRTVDPTIVHPVCDAWSSERCTQGYGEMPSSNMKQRTMTGGGSTRLGDYNTRHIRSGHK